MRNLRWYVGITIALVLLLIACRAHSHPVAGTYWLHFYECPPITVVGDVLYVPPDGGFYVYEPHSIQRVHIDGMDWQAVNARSWVNNYRREVVVDDVVVAPEPGCVLMVGLTLLAVRRRMKAIR